MQKQFQILEQLHKLSKETETKIKFLRDQIDEEFNKLKKSYREYKDEVDNRFITLETRLK